MGLPWFGRTGNMLGLYADHRGKSELEGHIFEEPLPESCAIRQTRSACSVPWFGTMKDASKWSCYDWGNRDMVRSFFDLEYPTVTNKVDVAIQVRLGDYYNFCGGTVLHPLYYDNIIDEYKIGSIHLYTDDPSDPYLKQLSKHSVKIVAGNATQHFIACLNYDTFVMANSTFSWWAAYLGNATKVFYPHPFLRGIDKPPQLPCDPIRVVIRKGLFL